MVEDSTPIISKKKSKSVGSDVKSSTRSSTRKQSGKHCNSTERIERMKINPERTPKMGFKQGYKL
jgi:hypothetical protein